MSTVSSHRVRDPPRACDICGHLWYKSDLTRIGPLQWACPDDVDGLTALQISRHNANARPLIVRPVRHGMGMTSIPDYTTAEADIFNLVLKYAPQQVFLAEAGSLGDNVDSVTGLDQARTAGWMALYLSNLVIENRRPLRWLQAAKTKLTALCDSMLSLQLGSPTSSANYQTVTATKTGYGGFYMPPTSFTWGSAVISLDVTGAALCLLALLRTYQITGLTSYRDGARRVATFLRRSQCIGLYDSAITGFYAEANTSAARFQPGPFPEAIPFDTSTLKAANTFANWTIKPQGLACAWAMNLLRQIDGDSTYGDAVATGDFVAPTASTLSSAIATAIAWWIAGAVDFLGDVKVGFSPATPRDNYIVFPNTVPVASSWGLALNAGVASANWALGIRALWEISGFSGQASTNYLWLRAGQPNLANEVPATWKSDQIARSLRGTYDPNLCLATLLDPNASDLTGYGYDWRTVGILAPIQSSRAANDLDTARSTLVGRNPRRWRMRMTTTGAPASVTGAPTTVEGAQFFRDLDTKDDMRLLTQTGLSFQTSVGFQRPEWTSGLSRGHYVDLQGAAIIADAYRYDPRPPNLMEPA